MPAKVVDASAMAAWAFRAPRMREALLQIQGVDLYALPPFDYDLANTAKYKAPLGEVLIREGPIADLVESRHLAMEKDLSRRGGRSESKTMLSVGVEELTCVGVNLDYETL